MNKREFIQLKIRIDKILKQVENDALGEGVNIISDKFQLILNRIKEKLLSEKGLSLENYEFLKEKFKKDKIVEDEDGIIDLAKKIQTARDKREGEAEVKLEESKKKFQEKILETTNNFSERLNDVKITTNKEKKEILNEFLEEVAKVRSEIPSISKHNDFDHVRILRDLNNSEMERKELKKKNLELKDEIGIFKNQTKEETKEKEEILDNIITAVEKLYERPKKKE